MAALDIQPLATDQTLGKDPAQVLLGFESGNEYWLVDLADAGEVLPVPELCEVPLTQPWFRGIANVRGTLYSVTDLAAFHGGEPTVVRARARLLMTGAHLKSSLGGNMALLMAGTHGLKPLSQFETVDTANDDASWKQRPWLGTRYRDTNGRIWTQLLLPTLMSAAEFLDIAA